MDKAMHRDGIDRSTNPHSTRQVPMANSPNPRDNQLLAALPEAE
jgi:hypothetical protein